MSWPKKEKKEMQMIIKEHKDLKGLAHPKGHPFFMNP